MATWSIGKISKKLYGLYYKKNKATMSENLESVICRDWSFAFPQLYAYKKNKFYKLLGPIITGIELIKIPFFDGYAPHFVFYSLWHTALKDCLVGPNILLPFRNKREMQLHVPYKEHAGLFQDVVDSIERQLPFSLNGNVSLKTLFCLIDNYSQQSTVGSNSYFQARLVETKLYLALYCGSDGEIQRILRAIKNANWNLEYFKMFNVSFDDWFQNVQKRLNLRDEFLTRIINNKTDKKLSKLSSSEIELP